MKIESCAKDIKASDEKIFRMLSDCRSIQKMLPPQVKNWKADEDRCEFEIEGIAKANVNIAEKMEFSYIAYQVDNDKNMPLSFTFNIEKHGDLCDLTMKIDMNVPVFLQPMVRPPLQKVTDTALERIKSNVEQE